MTSLHPLQIEPLVKRALNEDWGHADWTTDLCVDEDILAEAKIVVKQDYAVLSGTEVAFMVFKAVDPELEVRFHAGNGDNVKRGEVLCSIKGKARSILKGERVALNFLGRLCGIATHTYNLVSLMEGSGAELLDTRKTTPGLRILEKAASSHGGAKNHRYSLTDGVMLKENHIAAAGGIAKAMSRLTESLPPTVKVEVETTNLSEVEQALDAGADIIMLDNMTTEEMKKAVAMVDGRAKVEASGNVTADNVADIAATGVDYISTSAMFHSSKGADLSLLLNL